MNILIDIGHPAHVHLFRNLYFELTDNGHHVIVTVKNIESAKALLRIYNIPFIEIGNKKDSIVGKFIGQILFLRQLLSICKQHQIKYAIGSSITIAHLSFISSIKSFVFDDDDSAVEPLMAKFGHPFASYLVSPDALKDEPKKNKHVNYAGYHELAYLHPIRYTPDPSVLYEAGLIEGDTFFIVRFNAFKAHHDIGIKGLSIENKRKLINLLIKRGKVFITSERDLEPEFEKFRLLVAPEKAHSLMYYATMLIGDSQTMTSEAALLGTPALKCNSFAGKLSVPNEIENKYKLCYSFLPEHFNILLQKIDELFKIPDLKAEWQRRRMIMLMDKIDVTAFFFWFIENYPESFETIKRNPDYQYKFR